MNLFARSQYQLRTEILTLLDDTSNARWTNAQVYAAINQALSMWGGRVLIPHLYQPTNYTWNNNTYDYSLPSWMDERYIQPQLRRQIPYNGYPITLTTDGTETWEDIPGWTIEPTTTEGRKLRFQTMPYAVSARIIYWSQQYQIPTTIFTLDQDIVSSTDTTIYLTDQGQSIPHLVYCQIGNEIVSGEFSTRDGARILLTNVNRGMINTFATSHSEGTSTYLCVNASDERLFVQLHDQAMAILHRLRFALAAPEERQVHGQMIQLYQSRADAFWKSWTPNRPVKSNLNRRML